MHQNTSTFVNFILKNAFQFALFFGKKQTVNGGLHMPEHRRHRRALPYSAQPAVGAGSQSADTSRRGKGPATRSPPTGRTRPPSRQSGS